MNHTGQDGPGTLAGGPAGLPPRCDSPPSAGEQPAAARSRRPRPRTLILAAAVTAAVAGAGVTAGLLTVPAGRPPTPLTTVTRALAATAAGSYRFTLDSAVNYRGRVLHSDVVSGSYDPGHRAGAEVLATRTSLGALVRVQIRFAGTYVYTQQAPGSGYGKPWNKSPVPPAAAALPPSDVYGFASDEPVSPAELSAVLRFAATVRRAGAVSGQGWTGTRYTFTARFPGADETVTGTIDIDQHGHIRRVVTITAQGTHGRLTTDQDLTLGDFGAPVPVTTPPASQVGYTSTPYSGYLF
jgi:hypothetical protein